jgi:signal transduction histidine kinase
MRVAPATPRSTSLLPQQLVNVKEEERRRIAQDLHDQLGQRITALRLRIECLTQAERRGDLHRAVADLLKLTDAIDRELDFFAWQLRPVPLDGAGLIPELRHFVREWSELARVTADFHALNVERRLAADVETCVYRISQEALTNIARHAHATFAGVLIERRSHDLVLVVEDNGRGFDPGAVSTAKGHPMGLAGMRERAAAVGGRLEIETTPGGGTTVFLSIPNRVCDAACDP